MSEYFPEAKYAGDRVKVELDLFNYATKVDLKKCNSFCYKVNFANLKPDVDKLDIDKLKSVPTNLNNFKNNVYKLVIDKLALVPVDLSKLSDVVKIMLLKKMCIMLR